LDIKAYLNPLIKWWWLIICAVCLAIGSTYFFISKQPPVYLSHTTLVIGNLYTDPNPSNNDFYLNQQLGSFYSNLATTEPVKEATLKSLGLTILPKFTVKPQGNNQFIEIDVTDSDPVLAMQVANELAKQIIALSPAAAQANGQDQNFTREQIDKIKKQIEDTQTQIDDKQNELSKLTSAHDIATAQFDLQTLQTKLTIQQSNFASLIGVTKNVTNSLQIIEIATIPTQPVGPNKYVIVGIAAIIGCVLSVGAAYFMEFIDDGLYSADDIKKHFNVRIIGFIADLGKKFNGSPYVYENSYSHVAEAYRTLRANLDSIKEENTQKVFLITSPDTGDGKSTISVNLAISFAQSGRRVLLVDSDIRKPTIDQYLSIENNVGLVDVIKDTHRIETVISKWRDLNLSVMTTGIINDENPDLIFTQENINTFLYDIREIADVVIIDSPPLFVTDSLVLATQVDGVVLVLRAGHCTKDMLKATIEKLEVASAKLIGIVLNKIQIHDIVYGSVYRNASPYYYSNYGNKNKSNGKGRTHPDNRNSIIKIKKIDNKNR
jgi:capsular exopolysaccharide synthesis family protein